MGYIGQSRSNRSYEAIDNGEMPLSMLKKEYLDEIIEDNNLSNCSHLSVEFVKFVARRRGSSSWHHTGKFYNKTDHYDFVVILEKLNDLDIQNKYLEEFSEYKKAIKEEKINQQNIIDEILLVSFVEDIWEGTRNHPKKVSYDRVGVMKGDWIYTDILYAGNLKKVSATANKNHSIKVHKTVRTLACSEAEKEEIKKIKKVLQKKENKKIMNAKFETKKETIIINPKLEHDDLELE